MSPPEVFCFRASSVHTEAPTVLACATYRRFFVAAVRIPMSQPLPPTRQKTSSSPSSRPPSSGARDDLTILLREVSDGADDAKERLWRLVYNELYRIAKRELARRYGGPATLSATSVVHEAYIRLIGNGEGELPAFENRLHFFATGARVMRSVIIDYARHQGRQKRGGDAPHVSFGVLPRSQTPADDGGDLERLLSVEHALTELEAFDADLARVVELRFFGGLLESEIAHLEGVSTRTIQRRWRRARAFLGDRLR